MSASSASPPSPTASVRNSLPFRTGSSPLRLLLLAIATSPQPGTSSLTRFENNARPRRLPEHPPSIDLNPFPCFSLNGESGTAFLLAPTLRYPPYQGLLSACTRSRRHSLPTLRHVTLRRSLRILVPRSRGDVPRLRSSSPSRLPNPSPTEFSARLFLSAYRRLLHSTRYVPRTMTPGTTCSSAGQLGVATDENLASLGFRRRTLLRWPDWRDLQSTS